MRVQEMKRCRRCNAPTLSLERESLTRRGRHTYVLAWYRCSECHEVRLSFHRLRESVVMAAEEAGLTDIRENEPILSS